MKYHLIPISSISDYESKTGLKPVKISDHLYITSKIGEVTEKLMRTFLNVEKYKPEGGCILLVKEVELHSTVLKYARENELEGRILFSLVGGKSPHFEPLTTPKMPKLPEEPLPIKPKPDKGKEKIPDERPDERPGTIDVDATETNSLPVRFRLNNT